MRYPETLPAPIWYQRATVSYSAPALGPGCRSQLELSTDRNFPGSLIPADHLIVFALVELLLTRN
jgi:hypothetical protein